MASLLTPLDDNDTMLGSDSRASLRRCKTVGSQAKLKQLQIRKDIQWSTCKTLLMNLRTFIPERFLCCCLKPNARQRRISKTYRELRKEVSIESIIRQLRVLNAAVKKDKTKQQWFTFKRTHSIRPATIDSDLEEDASFSDLIKASNDEEPPCENNTPVTIELAHREEQHKDRLLQMADKLVIVEETTTYKTAVQVGDSKEEEDGGIIERANIPILPS
mmetsp:Transcript_25686/g.34296  ORF Transcript_25686/g.34296 Transcript_25686/m.34296 type:complete len:218 (+) Transcript_25686:539-1192(+)